MREEMFDKNISMDDVHFAIKNIHNRNQVSCVYLAIIMMMILIFRLRIRKRYKWQKEIN